MKDRPKLKYVHYQRPKGRLYADYRRAGTRQKIEGDVGSPEWLANYTRIHAAFEAGKPEKPGQGTFAWLVERYLDSPEFDTLKPRTKRDYQIRLDELRKTYGGQLWRDLTRRNVIDIRDRHKATPRKANYYLSLLSIVGRYAKDLGLREDNPAEGIKKIRVKSDGFRDWTAEEMEQFLAGVTNATCRRAFLLALYTGQRQGDILRMTRKDIEGGVISVRQSKTGERVYIPIHPRLAGELERGTKGIYLVAGRSGKPYSEDGFRSVWYAEMQRLGLKGPTFHGLRKNATAALVEAGCDDREVMAITGHKTTAMVSHYSKAASQKRLAESAIVKLRRKDKE